MTDKFHSQILQVQNQANRLSQKHMVRAAHENTLVQWVSETKWQRTVEGVQLI